MKRRLFFVFFGVLCSGIFAQETVLVGQVTGENREPLAGATVCFKGTSNGMLTNEEGYFMVRTFENQTVVVVSLLGYEKQEIRLTRGQSTGVEIVLREKPNWLPEVFVLPGENPALEIIRKVRLFRAKNNLLNYSDFRTNETAQNTVFLVKNNYLATQNNLWRHLESGNLSANDSVLLVPLVHMEEKFRLTGKNRTQTERNLFETAATADRLAQQILHLSGENLDFYQNTLTFFGSGFVSPLANVGNVYYKFFLADSILTANSKCYEIHFRSVNRKNLAFDGKIWIDSATFSLCGIEAQLPAQANINFIKDLKISQQFGKNQQQFWSKTAENIRLNLEYRMFSDTALADTRLYITRTSTYQSDSLAALLPTLNTAEFADELLSEKMAALRRAPLYRSALWVADVLLTGNAKWGKIDIGNVKNIVRISRVEGLKIALPLQTNEDFLKNFALGCHLGYGFKNGEIGYSAFAKWKLPTTKKRTFSANYFDDYRRVDYDYNNFLLRENPFAPEDEDCASTVMRFRQAQKINRRREFSLALTNDWNRNLESAIYFRKNTIFPLFDGENLHTSSLTLSTRFSSAQRSYEDHLRRIYLQNVRPVLYLTAEMGNYTYNSKSGNYAKFSASLAQYLPLMFGTWNYLLRADAVAGNVPLELLAYLPGNETGGYTFSQFSLTDYAQFPSDRQIQWHNELIFNGIIFNHIPFIQNFNLREMLTFKMGYGGQPNLELGAGIANILRCFAFQSVWGAPNASDPNRWRWQAQFYFYLSF